MKKIVFALLIAVNLALVLTLIASSYSVPAAKAQARGSRDYAMVTARLDADEDLLYIVDMRTSQMVGLRYSENKERLMRYTGLSLLSPQELRRRQR